MAFQNFSDIIPGIDLKHRLGRKIFSYKTLSCCILEMMQVRVIVTIEC